MGKCTEDLQRIQEDLEAEMERITISTQERWLANTSAIRKRRRNEQIAASVVFIFVKGSQVAKGLVKKGMKEAGMWYSVVLATVPCYPAAVRVWNMTG
jgi:hypothetical protein